MDLAKKFGARVNVWAENGHIPGNICEDARLRSRSDSDLHHLGDASHGQAGWHVGIKFADFQDLAMKLPTIVGVLRNVARLAIHAHGVPGSIEIDGPGKTPLTVSTLGHFRAPMSSIWFNLTPNAVVLFMGCLAGQDREGEELLKAISTVWAGRRIVGFQTMGFVSAANQKREGEACTEPGMRDTPFLFTAGRDDRERYYGRNWTDLRELPWASETSPSAVVAQNGKILYKGSGWRPSEGAGKDGVRP